MSLFEWVVLIFIIGGIIYGIDEAFKHIDNFWESIFKFICMVIFFIPVLLIEGVKAIKNDKEHRLGYIALFIVFGFITFGLIMSFIAGPSSPAPWDY